MIEQADVPQSPLSSPEQLPSKDSRGKSSTSEVENEAEKRQRRVGRAPADLQLQLEIESDHSENRKKPTAMRLKPAEQLSPMATLSDFETKFDRKKLQPNHISKTNTHYHKLFKEVSKDELLKQSYTCALYRDILYQGKMFVSDNWICFHSKVFGRDTKITIPVKSVQFIKKKTALLVPNALVIETSNDQHVFASLLSRNSTFKLLKSICLHLEMDKACTTPVTSSCENSFRSSCPPSHPLDFSGNFSDLDRVVEQKRRDMMESSSSGSQTPDDEKIHGYTDLQDAFLRAPKIREVSVHADIHLQTPSQKHGATLKKAVLASSVSPIRGATPKVKSSKPKSLHIILTFYLILACILVMSTGYMAFKIMSLEHRLNSIMMGEQIRSGESPVEMLQDEGNAEICGELFTNLFRIEKIKKNLQKLLKEK